MAGVKGRSGGARPNSGGARPNSGPKPKAPQTADVVVDDKQDPKSFLVSIMGDPSIDIKLRADAAKALLNAELRSQEAKGKKEERNDAAKRASTNKFAPSAPPKLVVNNK